jgi:hypothetical protein
MKWPQKAIFVALLTAGVTSLAMAATGSTSKWITSAGLCFDMAGIVQLEISGLLRRILDRYWDPDAHPYGPPSHEIRDFIENPDTPVRTFFRRYAFFDVRTGFYLLLIGFALQLLAAWA